MGNNGQADTNAVVSLTMGIFSVLFFPLLVGWVFGLIGLVYGNRSIRQAKEVNEKENSLAVAGKTCSIVGIALGIISIIVLISGLFIFSFRTGI